MDLSFKGSRISFYHSCIDSLPHDEQIRVLIEKIIQLEFSLSELQRDYLEQSIAIRRCVQDPF